MSREDKKTCLIFRRRVKKNKQKERVEQRKPTIETSSLAQTDDRVQTERPVLAKSSNSIELCTKKKKSFFTDSRAFNYA